MDPVVKDKQVVNNQVENKPVWTEDEWDNFNSEYSIG